MNLVHLTVEVLLLTSRGGFDDVEVVATRDFHLPLAKAPISKGWATKAFNKALRNAGRNQVVRATITGTSEDGLHRLATGSICGWMEEVKMADGVFDC